MKQFLLLLCLLPLLCPAQEDLQLQTKNDKLSIGVSFTPEYSYRFTRSSDAYGDFQLENIAKDETGRFAFRTGLTLDYEILPWLSFETGLLYANKGYRSDEFSLRENEWDEGVTGRLKLNAHYLSVPLKAKFYVLGRDFPLFLTAGFSPDFFLGHKMKFNGDEFAYYQDGGVKFNAVNLCGLVGVGTKYNINSNIYLEAEAGFKSSMMPMNDGHLQRRLYSFGLDLRVYYRLASPSPSRGGDVKM